MNIFDIYLEKITKIIKNESKHDLLKLPDKLDSINVEIPPKHFDCDVSTNVSMVLAKIISINPNDLAKKISKLIKKDDDYISNIDVAKPGFINIKFNQKFWNEFIKNLVNNANDYGKVKNLKEINI